MPGGATIEPTDVPDLKLGYQCNNRCVVCPYGDARERDPERPLDAVRAALDGRGRREERLTLTGGEVLLRKDLASILGATTDAGFRDVSMVTNGRMLAYPRLAGDLVRAGLRRAVVLVLGPTAEIHDHHTRVPGSFAQTIAGIANFLGAGGRVATRTILTRSNYRHLAELARLLCSLAVEEARFAMIPPAGESIDRPFVVLPALEVLSPPLGRAIDILERGGVAVTTEGIPACHLPRPEVAAEICGGTATTGKGDAVDDWSTGRAFGPGCDACSLRARCGGVLEVYARELGTHELRPVAPGG